MTQTQSEIDKSALRLASEGKLIHLKDFLPGHLEQSVVGDFIEFFEYFLNTLYYNEVSARGTNDDFEIDLNGVHTYYATSSTSAGDIVTSADPNYDTSAIPVRYEITSADTISILEKAKRIADLHDPDLIDIEYIQRLANLMGYNVLLNKTSLTEINLGYNAQTEEDINSYLRFVVSNLPNWYKIKTTRDSVKVLLYSLGIVGDLVYRWTSDNITSANPYSGGYGNNPLLWKDLQSDIDYSVVNVPENYFPTPHFSVTIDANNTPPAWFSNVNNVINALENIRPINNVFHSLSIIFTERFDDIYVRMDSYDRIKTMFPINTYIPPWSEGGLGDMIIPNVIVSGLGFNVPRGSGSLEIPHVNIEGVGQTSYIGTGILEIPLITINGIGKIGHFGLGDMIIPNMIVSGYGVHTSESISGIGLLEIPEIVIDGNAQAPIIESSSATYVFIESSSATYVVIE